MHPLAIKAKGETEKKKIGEERTTKESKKTKGEEGRKKNEKKKHRGNTENKKETKSSTIGQCTSISCTRERKIERSERQERKITKDKHKE